MKVFALIALSIGLSNASSAAAQEHAWQWPLKLPEPAVPVYRVGLTESVYAVLQDPLLRDVDILRSDGQRVSVALDSQRVRHYTNSAQRAVPWFPLRAEEVSNSNRLRAVIEGQRIILETGDAGAAEKSPIDLPIEAILIDLGEQADTVRGLELKADPNDSAQWSLQLQVESSADLSEWRSLRPPVQLYRLQHGAHLLSQLSLQWGATPSRYLRLRVLGQVPAERVAGVEAVHREVGRSAAPQLSSVALDASPGEQPGEWLYRTPGPLPVRAWSLELESGTWLLEAQLSSRSAADRPWVGRGSMIAYQIMLDGEALSSESAELSPTRDRHWRLRLSDAQASPPRLRLAYLPDVLVFSGADGDAFKLVAGSSRARRQDAPMAALLAVVRSRLGADWEPPMATLGTRSEWAGEAALQSTDAGQRWGRLLLWGLLVGVALSLVTMTLRLMRSGASSDSGSG